MKKFVSILLIFTVVLSSLSGAYAQNLGHVDKKNKEKFTYHYKGIEIDSDSPLAKEQLHFIYDKLVAKKSDNESIIEMQIVDPPPEEEGSIVLGGPVRTTYDNSNINILLEPAVNTLVFAVDAAVWVLIGWKAAVVSHFLTSMFTNPLEEWAESQPDFIYSEKWVWKSYSPYHDCYIVYGSIMQYSDSTYNTPLKIQTYEIGKEC